jgi:hypothetical protein
VRANAVARLSASPSATISAEQITHRSVRSHRAYPSLRAARARDDAKTDLGLCEARTAAGDDEVATECELTSTTERIAFYGGDAGLRAASQGFEHAIGLRSNVIERGHVGHLGDVGAGHEHSAGARQHDGAHFRLGLIRSESALRFSGRSIVSTATPSEAEDTRIVPLIAANSIKP